MVATSSRFIEAAWVRRRRGAPRRRTPLAVVQRRSLVVVAVLLGDDMVAGRTAVAATVQGKGEVRPRFRPTCRRDKVFGRHC